MIPLTYTSTLMDDLEKFVDFLFEDQQGFVYSPIKKPDDWVSEFFAWPTERTALLDHIKLNGSENDVYICPSVFSKKEAKKDSFKSSRTVWVEFDGKEQIDFKDIPTPDIIVQTSSSTHLHCYWRTGENTNGAALDEINRRLTYYLGADSSGWDCTQLLRPPTSKNVKRGGLPVLLAHYNEKVHEHGFNSFDSAPKVETEAVQLIEAQLINPTALLAQLPLLKSLKDKIEKEPVSEGQRSQFLYKIAHELAEIGCNHTQIASIIWFVDDRIGKFVGRSDRLQRVSELASLAIHAVGVEEEINLYTLTDVLNHTEDLEWIYDKWLHNQGLMIVTGAPGVGKTQFCLQLMSAFSVGGKFLTSVLTPQKVLFWSLEMDVRELKFILRKQASQYEQSIHSVSENVRIMDEPGTLLQYEELLEKFDPGVLIIDSLFELSDGSLNDGAEVIQLTRWMKRMRKKYNCAIVMIHHNRKGSGTNKKPNKLEDMFGSVVLNKEIDTAFCLWQEEDSDEIDLIPVKARFSVREDMKIVRNENLMFEPVESEKPETGEPTGAREFLKFSFGS